MSGTGVGTGPDGASVRRATKENRWKTNGTRRITSEQNDRLT